MDKTTELIWRAGVAAVDSARLVNSAIHRSNKSLVVCGETLDLASLRRLIVVGAGKASAGMARGLEQVLGGPFLDVRVDGWINVPADCVVPLHRIHLHAARPAGLNEPTEAGVVGSQRILELVSQLDDRDLCLVLLSGGGSALLPLPVDGISLADKQAVTRTLSRTGATIYQLNTVRKRLSRIKGGGLLRAASHGRMIALIISDVVGDPLDIIASGPTICDSGTATDALDVIHNLSIPADAIPATITEVLRQQVCNGDQRTQPRIDCQNYVIGNNQTALDAAVEQARSLGFEVQSLGSGRQGVAREVGIELAERCLTARQSVSSNGICFIGGGEPVVQLATTDRPRRGGRNQELALAALCRLWNEDLHGIEILSGGTDGEDGPTDAAGAICNETIRDTARNQGLDPFDALSINDSYTFFDRAGGLLKTGPTHTNVMDLQVAVVKPH